MTKRGRIRRKLMRRAATRWKDGRAYAPLAWEECKHLTRYVGRRKDFTFMRYLQYQLKAHLAQNPPEDFNL